METYTIRSEHDRDHRDMKRILESLTQAGSCFMSHATWRCALGDHAACLEVEAECEEEVLLIVPPILRSRTIITRVNPKRGE